MIIAAVRSLVDEARRVGFAVREDASRVAVGPVAVSGMLAEQLVKELSLGAEPGAVIVGASEAADRAEVLVRIIAGDPTPDDVDLARVADAVGTPLVFIQLWPQAEWRKPFVLTPFVVECRAGEGFPVREIGDRIVEACANAAALSARVPRLADAARSGATKSAVVRSALIALTGSRSRVARPLLTLEQVRLLSQVRAASGATGDDELRLRAIGAAGVLAGGFGLRSAARALRGFLPRPLADAVVAAAGTWAVARLAETAESVLASRSNR
jgi:hypothetical protein